MITWWRIDDIQLLSTAAKPSEVSWRAHESEVVSVDLIAGSLGERVVTAGIDGDVHVWSITGGHIGTCGLPQSWA
jgi:hypothetical protein